MNDIISIVIVDDHALFAEIWAELFKSNPQFSVVDICNNTTSAIEVIKAQKPTIVFMDINLQPISGIDATKIIRKISPGTKVIGVSMYNQLSFAKKMIKNGASGYITKSSHKKEMLDSINAVINGEIYICKEMQQNISKQFLNKGELPDINSLSDREIEIIFKIKEGFSAKEIAEKLFISRRTVESHRSNIFKKLNLKNTASLLKFISNTSLGA